MTDNEKLRVLELYSGIGGMHWALQESGISYEVVAAIDINTTANKIYRHNFKGTYLLESGIETLTVTQIDRMKIDMILMSPPCQPFTRVGKKLDNDDLRTKSFLHLLDLLPQLSHCPSYILVENVKGFEESQTHAILMKALNRCQFKVQEYLLTPLQFGIPNSRLRYYMIAKRHQTWSETTEICYTMPAAVHPYLKYKNLIETEDVCYYSEEEKQEFCKQIKDKDVDICQVTENCVDSQEENHKEENHGTDLIQREEDKNKSNMGKTESKNSTSKRLKTKHNGDHDDEVKHSIDSDCCCLCGNDKDLLRESKLMRQDDGTDDVQNKCLRLHNFLENEKTEYFEKYKVPDKDLKRLIVMDIVFPCIRKTICFTKRYGHYMEGAGSIIQMSRDVEDVKKVCELKKDAVENKNYKNWGEDEISLIRNLQLRYFTPREIANLLCFPETFSFPGDVSTIQKYRVLGNSLNVHVVSVLIKLLLHKDPQ